MIVAHNMVDEGMKELGKIITQIKNLSKKDGKMSDSHRRIFYFCH
jgi:hypothetical protein